MFDPEKLNQLNSDELYIIKCSLVQGLAAVTGLPLEVCGDRNNPHCTDIHTPRLQTGFFSLSWEGFIGSSDCRDDGLLTYGAHLFPMIGSLKAATVETSGDNPKYANVYVYLRLDPGAEWIHCGWQTDEYGEYDHWYR